MRAPPAAVLFMASIDSIITVGSTLNWMVAIQKPPISESSNT